MTPETIEETTEGGLPIRDLFGVWTPLQDKLPEYMCAVLVWAPQFKNIYCAYYYFYSGSEDPNRKPTWVFFDNDGRITPVREEITHWMPLPSPPNAGSDAPGASEKP
jgi:hypothetical protein